MFPVEVFQATLSKLTVILRTHGIRFHLTGGLTGAAYGEPRMTQDIDVVIDPAGAKLQVDSLVKSIGSSDFMFTEDSMRRAIDLEEMFQLLDEKECLKLDVYPRELIPGELDRSEQMEVFAGEFLPIVSRVDAAVSKLIWISKGSHKSRRDLRAIFRNCDQHQQTAVADHAAGFGLQTLLEEVLQESDEIQ